MTETETAAIGSTDESVSYNSVITVSTVDGYVQDNLTGGASSPKGLSINQDEFNGEGFSAAAQSRFNTDEKFFVDFTSFNAYAYGVEDISLSVPSVIGRGGVEKHVEVKLWPKELMGLQQSARALKETLQKIKV